MSGNLVKELKDALGISMAKLAKMVGKQESTLNAWALLPGENEAKRLAEIASDAGLHRIAHGFLVLAGQEQEEVVDVGLERLSGDERRLAEWAIRIYKSPENDLQRGIIQALWGSMEVAGGKPEWVAQLNDEQLEVLKKLATLPDVVDSVKIILSGGNPLRASETDSYSKASERKTG